MESKEERHELYKGALDWFFPLCGICYAINEYRRSKGGDWPPIRLYELPEIWEQKPEEMHDDLYEYWFPLNAEGAEKRKQILLNAIEATKP